MVRGPWGLSEGSWEDARAKLAFVPCGLLVPVPLCTSPAVAFPFCLLLSAPVRTLRAGLCNASHLPPSPTFFFLLLIYFPFFLIVPALAQFFEVSAPCAVRFLPPGKVPSLLPYPLLFQRAPCSSGQPGGLRRVVRDFSPPRPPELGGSEGWLHRK